MFVQKQLCKWHSYEIETGEHFGTLRGNLLYLHTLHSTQNLQARRWHSYCRQSVPIIVFCIKPQHRLILIVNSWQRFISEVSGRAFVSSCPIRLVGRKRLILTSCVSLAHSRDVYDVTPLRQVLHAAKNTLRGFHRKCGEIIICELYSHCGGHFQHLL